MMAMKHEANIPPPPGYDEMTKASNSNNPSNVKVAEIEASTPGYSRNEVISLILRSLAIVLTFIATVIISASKHSESIFALTDLPANKYVGTIYILPIAFLFSFCTSIYNFHHLGTSSPQTRSFLSTPWPHF